MDDMRLRKLAGIETTVLDELALLEKVYQGKNLSAIDTDVMPVEEVQKRMDAASKAMGLINRLEDPEKRKDHYKRVMANMNTIRAALNYMIKNG